jgi:hypothetical protein
LSMITYDCKTELLGSLHPDVIVIHAIQHVKPKFDASAKRSQLFSERALMLNQLRLSGSFDPLITFLSTSLACIGREAY